MVTPVAHREAAAYLQATYEMSQRRAEKPKVPTMRSIVGRAAEV